MKTVYIECTNGISSDMVLKALLCAGSDEKFVENCQEKMHQAMHQQDGLGGHSHDHSHEHPHEHGHEHSHDHGGQRGYGQITELIKNAGLDDETRGYLSNIYTAIAKAEARVHGATLETVHFHEVGRAEAILNLTGVAAAAASLKADQIICSPVHDGHGTINCSHGIIPVPVPAVAAMKDQCDYEFIQDDVETEMVTPSGLGVLIGLGARCGKKPEGTPASQGEGKGSRDIGREHGLIISIYQ